MVCLVPKLLGTLALTRTDYGKRVPKEWDSLAPDSDLAAASTYMECTHGSPEALEP